MELAPTAATYNRSARKEILWFLWDPILNYLVEKGLPWTRNFNQIYLVYAGIFYFLNLL